DVERDAQVGAGVARDRAQDDAKPVRARRRLLESNPSRALMQQRRLGVRLELRNLVELERGGADADGDDDVVRRGAADVRHQQRRRVPGQLMQRRNGRAHAQARAAPAEAKSGEKHGESVTDLSYNSAVRKWWVWLIGFHIPALLCASSLPKTIAASQVTPELRASLTAEYTLDIVVAPHDGDAWSRLARRVTGDAERWKDIAAFNGASETLASEQRVRVPFSLLRPQLQRQIATTL